MPRPTTHSGFVDLRIGNGARGIGDDSVWPSFTDIMTVIVMIFLMALVVMMVRNFELDRQLVTTESDREAGIAANRNLLEKIQVLESQLLGLRESLDLSQGERDALRAQLLEELKRIESMVANNITLEEQLAGIIRERDRLSAEKQQLTEQSQERIAGLSAQFDALQVRSAGEIEVLSAANLALEAQLADLIGERDRLAAEKQQLAEQSQERIAALSAQLEALQVRSAGEIENLNTANLILEAQLADLIGERDRLSAEKQQLAEQSQERIAALSASEAELSRQMSALSAQFDALQVRSAGEIEALSTASRSLTQQLDGVSAQLQQVTVLLQTEQQQRRVLGLRVEAQERELAAKEELLAQLQSMQAQSTDQYAEAQTRIDQLNESIRRRQLENAALQELADASGAQFRSLQEEYDSLDAQYRTLARPARNPAGKYVVDIWYLKSERGFRFRLREPSQAEPVDYTRAELERRLADLKEKQRGNLYTKIIIPEESNLSHNEAWRFTQEILQGYDYYHQQP